MIQHPPFGSAVETQTQEVYRLHITDGVQGNLHPPARHRRRLLHRESDVLGGELEELAQVVLSPSYSAVEHDLKRADSGLGCRVGDLHVHLLTRCLGEGEQKDGRCGPGGGFVAVWPPQNGLVNGHMEAVFVDVVPRSRHCDGVVVLELQVCCVVGALGK